MGTSSSARQFVRYPALTTVLIVGVLLLASVASLYAEPAAMQPVNWFSSAYAAAPVPRSGFLLPALAEPAASAGPRLLVTERAVKGTMPFLLSRADGQSQTPPKQKRSWFARNWWWVIPSGVVVAGLVVLNVKCGSLEDHCS
jgi:hypothetical protein